MTILIIDPGHGGSDPGTVHAGIREKDIALAVSLLVRDKLSPYMTVGMTRTTDITQSIDAKAAIANKSGCDYCMSIHVNSGGGKGAETWVSVYGGKSRELGACIQTELAKVMADRGVKTRANSSGGNYYGMIRQPTAPAIIVEMGFLDNAEDRAFMTSPAGQEKLATAIANGVLRYTGKATLPPAQKVNSGKSTVKYRTQGSVAIKDSRGNVVGWTKRDQVLEGTLDGRWLRLGAGQYVDTSAGNGVMKVHRYKVLKDMYYRIDPNYKTHTPPRIAKAGTIVEGTYYESDKMLRLDRGLYLPKYLQGKKMMQRI